MSNYRLRRNFSIVAHAPDLVELRSGVWNATSLTLRDDSKSGVLARLIFRIDGSSSASQIADSEGVPLADVEQLFVQLNEMGAIETGATNAIDYVLDRVPGARASEFESDRQLPLAIYGDDAVRKEIEDLVSSSLVPMVPPISGDLVELASRVKSASTSWTDEGLGLARAVSMFRDWEAHLVIVASRTIDPDLLHRVNRICLQLQTPWLHTGIDGPFLLIGPLTVPHGAACFDCFETRVMMSLRESASYLAYKRAVAGSLVTLGQLPVEAVISALLASHTSLEVINYCLTGYSSLVGKVLSIYLPRMEFRYHDILKLPNCVSCASSAPGAQTELYFDMSAVMEATP